MVWSNFVVLLLLKLTSYFFLQSTLISVCAGSLSSNQRQIIHRQHEQQSQQQQQPHQQQKQQQQQHLHQLNLGHYSIKFHQWRERFGKTNPCKHSRNEQFTNKQVRNALRLPILRRHLVDNPIVKFNNKIRTNFVNQLGDPIALTITQPLPLNGGCCHIDDGPLEDLVRTMQESASSDWMKSPRFRINRYRIFENNRFWPKLDQTLDLLLAKRIFYHSTKVQVKRDGIQDHLIVAAVKERLRQATKEFSDQGMRFGIRLRKVRIREVISSTKRNITSSDAIMSIPTSSADDNDNNDHTISSNDFIVEKYEDVRDSFSDIGSIKKTLTEPLVDENIWNQLDGSEFQRYPETWHGLAKMGEYIAKNDESNEWIDWKGSGTSGNHPKGTSTASGGSSGLEDGAIHVWTGKSRKSNVRGENVPWIKTRSVIPYRPIEMVELLLDSKRVQTYNQWSLGREDCWVATATTISSNESNNHENDSTPSLSTPDSIAFTKIVRNRVQPPLGSKPMISTTLLHAQKVPTLHAKDGTEHEQNSKDNTAWIVVSRAVGGTAFENNDDTEETTKYGRSEILLGVNLLQPCPTDKNKTILTAVTHVYSSAVPTMLAERIGVKSAIKFVNDMRALKEQQQQEQQKLIQVQQERNENILENMAASVSGEVASVTTVVASN